MKYLPHSFLLITMMIDTHIHFERFVNDLKEALAQIESNQMNIDNEMAEMVKNNLLYDASLKLLTKRFEALRLAIDAGRR